MNKLVLEVKLKQRPFSANKMHFASIKRDTKAYRDFKAEIKEFLGGIDYKINKDDKYKLSLIVGFSNSLSDLDNSFKPLLDSMQLAMGFDDKQIFAIEALKDKTKKGEEYIMIRLEKITDSQWKQKLKQLFPSFFL